MTVKAPDGFRLGPAPVALEKNGKTEYRLTIPVTVKKIVRSGR